MRRVEELNGYVTGTQKTERFEDFGHNKTQLASQSVSCNVLVFYHRSLSALSY